MDIVKKSLLILLLIAFLCVTIGLGFLIGYSNEYWSTESIHQIETSKINDATIKPIEIKDGIATYIVKNNPYLIGLIIAIIISGIIDIVIVMVILFNACACDH